MLEVSDSNSKLASCESQSALNLRIKLINTRKDHMMQ